MTMIMGTCGAKLVSCFYCTATYTFSRHFIERGIFLNVESYHVDTKTVIYIYEEEILTSVHRRL